MIASNDGRCCHDDGDRLQCGQQVEGELEYANIDTSPDECRYGFAMRCIDVAADLATFDPFSEPEQLVAMRILDLAEIAVRGDAVAGNQFPPEIPFIDITGGGDK